jgi:hypothetical protein
MTTDYAMVLTTNYPGKQWTLDGEYSTLVWLSAGNPPTQAELDAAWPQVDYDNQVAAIEATRRTQYEAQSDGLFFAWQRGDATEVQWLDAVAKVKSDNPYPSAP